MRLDLDSLLCLHEQPTKCEDPEARGLFCSQCRLFDLQSNSALIARTCKLHTRHVVRRNHRRGCCRLQPDGRDDQSLSSSSCRAHSHSKPKHGSSKKERETERKPCCQCFVPTPHRENHQEFVFLRTHSVRRVNVGPIFELLAPMKPKRCELLTPTKPLFFELTRVSRNHFLCFFVILMVSRNFTPRP